jgi:hypothetical protein
MIQSVWSTLSGILCLTSSNNLSEEPKEQSEKIIHIKNPNFYDRSSDTITLEINKVLIPFKFDSICRSIPPIYQFRPKTEIGFEWKPFSSPALTPISISWNPNFDEPEIFKETQGPIISYNIFVGAQLVISGINRNVVVLSNGGSWNSKQQTALIAKDQYRCDSIRFEYKEGKLFPYYFSYCNQDDAI